MVLPYLKGLINKVNHFYLFQSCYSWVYLYFHMFLGWIYNTHSFVALFVASFLGPSLVEMTL